MQDTEPVQSLSDFFGHHGAARCRSSGPGQGPFLECLAESMDQALGGLFEIPLDMARKA